MELLLLFWMVQLQFQRGSCCKQWSYPSLQVQGYSSPLQFSDFHSWCRYCSSCWRSWRSIGVKLVGRNISGYYMPVLPNLDPPSFLTTHFGFIGIILCTCWIIWCILFHFNTPMTYQQDSSYHHQSFQSIINHQSLPTYLLDAFCNNLDFCLLLHLLQHLDSYQSPLTISSAIQCLNLFQSSPNFHCIFEFTSHNPSCLWSWCFCRPYPIQLWLLWLCQMQHSCPRYLKSQQSNWNWNHHPQVCSTYHKWLII